MKSGAFTGTSFVYDGLGRLRARQVYMWYSQYNVWIPTDQWRYLYDGNRVVQERINDNPVTAYTRGSDLSGSLEGAGGIGGLLARSDTYSGGTWTSRAFYHADGNGNVTCLVNSNLAVVASYKYDPYGRTISSSGSLASANVYRFSSKEIHADTGMYYYLYRFYDPNVQRWVNRDPILERGGANLYRFVANNPNKFVDLFGLADGNPVPPCAPYPDCLGTPPPPHVPTTPTSPQSPGLVMPPVRLPPVARPPQFSPPEIPITRPLGIACETLARVSPYLLLLALGGDSPPKTTCYLSPSISTQTKCVYVCSHTGNPMEIQVVIRAPGPNGCPDVITVRNPYK